MEALPKMPDDDDLVGDDAEEVGEGEDQGEEEEDATMEEEEGDDVDEDDDGMVEQMVEQMDGAEATGDSNMMVDYNRQYYYVPNSAIVRDYERFLDVPTREKMGEMIVTASAASKWPMASTIDPAAVVVLKGKFKGDDAEESYGWYMRLVLQGESNSDDMQILRHMPKGVVKDFLKYLSEDSEMAGSRLVTLHQPPDNNAKVLVPLEKVNNWTLVPTGQVPKSNAIKPAGQGGKTKADAPARGGEGAERENPVGAVAPAAAKPPPSKKTAATPPVKKAAAVQPPPKKAPAPAPAPAPAKKAPAAKQAPAKQTTLTAAAAKKPVVGGPSSSKAAGKAPASAPKPAPAAVDEDDATRVVAPGDGSKGSLVLRDTDCAERCVAETQTMTRTIEGTNDPYKTFTDEDDRPRFVANKILIPATCSKYKITIEYTLPSLEANGHA
ncbi:MAG: hypothetical protein ACKVI4_14890 [Actinomycetales bacterium]